MNGNVANTFRGKARSDHRGGAGITISDPEIDDRKSVISGAVPWSCDEIGFFGWCTKLFVSGATWADAGRPGACRERAAKDLLNVWKHPDNLRKQVC
ncbi:MULTISPECIES: hypothetical protein [unclassified Actinoplanes]|uniref:hypothetical protein n=1 Tax=unclassified Actinoplanes TaxID=2626549 RepID=UPI0012BAF957|nr:MULTISPECIES: hypothetical protein [unclassified Actinoplanes]